MNLLSDLTHNTLSEQHIFKDTVKVTHENIAIFAHPKSNFVLLTHLVEQRLSATASRVRSPVLACGIAMEAKLDSIFFPTCLWYISRFL